MTARFRATLVLMLLRRYAYGDHVRDVRALSGRISSMFRQREPLRLNADWPELGVIVDRLERGVDAGPVRTCLGGRS